ncbi:MAG: D-isomer specific 2-hydroxyacid dehydrogenase NAD-binding protein [Acidimicrobiaceae bacterium]|nr:D-isomer specific 2-hydroxyacid dehydrogenase NAD-binding protein [Acidimicrobiaceae bacterium]
MPVVVVGADAFYDSPAVAQHFSGKGIVRYEQIVTPEQVASATADAGAVVVAGHVLSAPLIAALGDGVRVIGRTGVGVDTVDLDAARCRGIAVFNEPDYGSVEVASHAIGMIIALQRKFLLADRFVRGGWNGSHGLAPIKPLDELRVGVIGSGRIGRATIARLLHLVGEVLVYDPLAPEVPEGAERIAELDDLLVRCDAITLHLPLTESSRGMIGRRELELLPPGAVVVNVARGGILDEAALADLLTSGHLAGAGLDVFVNEPLLPGDPILAAPNTILTPHCGSYSERAMWRLGTWTVGDAISFLTTDRLVHGNFVVPPGGGAGG